MKKKYVFLIVLCVLLILVSIFLINSDQPRNEYISNDLNNSTCPYNISNENFKEKGYVWIVKEKPIITSVGINSGNMDIVLKQNHSKTDLYKKFNKSEWENFKSNYNIYLCR